MADETVDLNFLARQGRQILDELRDARTEANIMRGDNRRVFGELAGNRAQMAGLTTEMTALRGEFATLQREMTLVRGELGGIRTTMDAILAEMREIRAQNASVDNRLRRLEEERG
jgi:chromosome segregation ATPase